MSPRGAGGGLSASIGLYRRLLRLLPRPFRDDAGPEMAAAFEARATRAQAEGGRAALLAVFARAAVDVAVTAVAERRAPAASARVPGVQRRATRGNFMGELTQDLRYAVRVLSKNPVFTGAAMLTLAVGIGLNAATFSVVHALLLRPLPGVEAPDRLVQLHRKLPGDFPYGSNSVPHFEDLRERLTPEVFEGVSAWSFQQLAVSTDGANERVMGMMVSADFFRTYRVEPVHGRLFLPGEEDRGPGAHPVAVVSEGFWRSRFGGDPAIVGRTILLNAHPFEVIGIVPDAFRSPIGVAAPPFYVPLMMIGRVMPAGGEARLEQRGSSFLQVQARLADGVSMEQARAATEALYGALLEEHPGSYDVSGGITFVPQSEAGLHPTFREAQVGLSVVMMAVVTVLLLIACVNLANLFLARARERRHEMGIRTSLGAGRGRIVRQLLTESLVFSAVSAGGGLLLALIAVRRLSAIRLPIEGPWRLEFTLDAPVLLFTTAISVAAAVLFGLAPALQAARRDSVGSLKGHASGGRRSRLSGGLVILQTALSLLLLVTSGLFLRSLQGALEIDTGFRADHLLVASMDPGLQGYTREDADRFYDALLERVRALPGVRSAALGEVVPLGMDTQQNGVMVPGYEFAPEERTSIDYNVVGPGYFETMGVTLLQGRGFVAGDDSAAPPVAVVNRTFAERFWPGQDPIGQVFHAGREWRVVGVVEAGKYNRLGEDPLPFMYFPIRQRPELALTLHVRTADDPAAIAGPVRGAVSELDSRLPLYDVKTMENHLGWALLPARLGGTVLGAFGAIGLFLAAIGMYGVMSYSVTQRRRELGIRLALGAERGQIVRQVLHEGLRLALVGALLGMAGAALAGRLVRGLLYGVGALDPVAFGLVPLLLVGVAALAAYLPARRAAAVDPMRTLRVD